MSESIRVPVRSVPKDGKWGALYLLALTHEICAEKVDCVSEKYSFAGGHRVRLYRFKKNVHWRIPESVQLDISAVPAANGAPPPRRKQDRR
jgi:hypothetical protein